MKKFKVPWWWTLGLAAVAVVAGELFLGHLWGQRRIKDGRFIGSLGLKVGGKPISYGREYWIVDAEGGTNYVVAKANCMPFQVAPGYRAQMPGPFPVSKGPMAKRPGPWPETVSGLGQSYVRNQYFEVLSPGGGVIASFRCRPFYTEPSFAVKLVTQTGVPREELIKQGAAMFPTGTVRRRTRNLYTVKRGP